MNNKAKVIFVYEDGDEVEYQYPCKFGFVNKGGDRPYHARIIGNKSEELYNDVMMVLHPIHGSFYHVGHKED